MQLFVLVSLEVIVVGEGEEVARGRRLRLTCSVVIVPMMVCDDVHLVSRRLGSFMLRRNFLSLPLRLSPSRHPARSCDGWRPNNDGWRPINGGRGPFTMDLDFLGSFEKSTIPIYVCEKPSYSITEFPKEDFIRYAASWRPHLASLFVVNAAAHLHAAQTRVVHVHVASAHFSRLLVTTFHFWK